MRTTLNIPTELIEEAKKVTGFRSKTDIVILGLNELIRKKKIQALKELALSRNVIEPDYEYKLLRKKK